MNFHTVHCALHRLGECDCDITAMLSHSPSFTYMITQLPTIRILLLNVSFVFTKKILIFFFSPAFVHHSIRKCKDIEEEDEHIHKKSKKDNEEENNLDERDFTAELEVKDRRISMLQTTLQV